MKQLESFPIENPCQQICRFNRQRYCRTCMRHMDERIHWEEYDDEEKRRVLRKCYRRKLAYKRAAYLQSVAERQHAPTQPTPRQLDLFNANKRKTPTEQPKKVTPKDDEESPQLSLF
ncbi:DUF1289 domain-containing protein [Suttonella sp. R2A3]|uniref:DUF1289 domain-containing protein n=1 Tax=Suttonella sp. R2A3 TaxID=2908648 RepID=UPI001F42F8FC|nr:DUF1289 domain-containing protein [Suttonella sp. R2A3]UJF24936.1 DUF1289 domain-containing protein [Suttonella sp. R2A3]